MRNAGLLVLMLLPAQEGPDFEAYLRRLEDDRLEEREAAEEALGALDPGILPRLRQALPGLKGEARERVASTIRRLEHRARLLQILPRPSTALIPEGAAPFRSAFESLRKQIRVPVELGEDLEGLDRAVRPAPGRVPPWEALDRLLAAHGAASLEVEGESLKVVRGARRPGVHRGAHAAWLQSLEADEERIYSEPATITSCTLGLAAAWEPGGPAPIRVRARLLEVADPKGLPLLDPDALEEWTASFTAGSKSPWQLLSLPLGSAPSPEAASLARLRVRVEFHYPLERADFRIDAASAGRRQAVSGAWTLVLVQLRSEDGPWIAQLRLASTQEVLVDSVKLTDKDGHVHDGVFSFEASPDDEGLLQITASFPLPGAPSKVEPRKLDVKLVTRIHAETLDLDLKDVPLAGP
jgi:hypothetical protein